MTVRSSLYRLLPSALLPSALLPSAVLRTVLLPAVLLSTALMSSLAHAVQLMDLRAEQLMIGADSIRKELDLTPNQQTLWQQRATKAQALLRARQQRRDRLQAEMKAALSSTADGGPDLRELNGSVDAEATASAVEDRQLRELWLSVNDALTDKQRSQVIDLLLSALERVDADGPRGPGGAAPREGGRGPGGRGQRPGGMGGMGGSGGMGGAGGGMDIGG